MVTFWDQQREGTFVYRYYGANSELLYVGIAEDVYKRFMQHSLNSPWFIDARKVMIENFATRSEALSVETIAIRTEGPLWNRTGPGVRQRERLIGPAPMERLTERCRRRNELRQQVECGRCRARIVRFARRQPW